MLTLFPESLLYALQHHKLCENNGVAMLYVKTMVCGVITNSLDITSILQTAIVTSKSVWLVHMEKDAQCNDNELFSR